MYANGDYSHHSVFQFQYSIQYPTLYYKIGFVLDDFA